MIRAALNLRLRKRLLTSPPFSIKDRAHSMMAQVETRGSFKMKAIA